MSEQAEITVELEYRLPEPITVSGTFHNGTRATGSRVRFRAYHSGPSALGVQNFGCTEAILFNDRHFNKQISELVDGKWTPPLPDWCPKPPEGWDAHVQAFREQVEAEAVAK